MLAEKDVGALRDPRRAGAEVIDGVHAIVQPDAVVLAAQRDGAKVGGTEAIHGIAETVERGGVAADARDAPPRERREWAERRGARTRVDRNTLHRGEHPARRRVGSCRQGAFEQLRGTGARIGEPGDRAFVIDA